MYDKITAFFMTGTGNSYRIARWCIEVAAKSRLEGELRQIRAGETTPAVSPHTLSVFSFPTHGFTAPWLMIKFAWNMPKGENRHAIVIPSRAGLRMKGVFLPGMEGTAGYLIALLLWIRGYTVRAVMGVDMPSNWTVVHWGLSEENAAVITTLAESKVRSLMDTALAGYRHYDGIVQLTIGLLLCKISLMYLILGQLILAKLFFASEKCNSCSLCSTICPKRALKMAGHPKRPYWTYSCDSCMACMNFCPQNAIEVSPVIITLFYYLTSVPVLAFAASYTAREYGLQLDTIPLLGFSIHYLYIVVAVAMSYAFLHFTLGSKIIRAIAGKLSHTRYFRRYRAKEVSLQDIHRQSGH